MNILGISSFFHDSACCLLRDGVVVAAVAEERFSRRKNDSRLPVRAFRHCLEAAGVGIDELDALAYYENPRQKLGRQLYAPPASGVVPIAGRLDPHRPEREIRQLLGYEGQIHFYDHHQSHAASSFLFSEFEEAAILTVDGVGEWATTTFAAGRGTRIEMLSELRFPHSIGLLYGAVTNFLGFKVLSGEYKVMGLAPYGRTSYTDALRRLVRRVGPGEFELDLRYFDFRQLDRMYTDALAELLGMPARAPESALQQEHMDVARSLQALLEEILLQQVAHLHAQVGSAKLCMAGGVALNCVANRRILRDGPFEQLFVQPAAGDAGSALGAAALAWTEQTGQRPLPLEHVYLGPAYSNADVLHMLKRLELTYLDYRGRLDALARDVAERIARGQVVGWFQGGMEFGPRALGARSILASPADPTMRDRLNQLVKKREAFRPFAPAVLAEDAARFLELDHPVPFMTETCGVRTGDKLPAITHVDGSCRPQTVSERDNPRFASLLRACKARSGWPIAVNTSFNVRGEPIVCTPLDALRCMGEAELDCLVIEDFVLDKASLPPGFSLFAASSRPEPPRDVFGGQRHSIEATYTFI